MRRVVVTGLGIVSSIGNNAAGGARHPARGPLGHRRARQTTPSSASAARCMAAPKLDPESVVDRRAMRFQGGGTALEPRRDGSGDRRCRARAGRGLQRAHRHHHGLGRALDPGHRRGRRHHPRARARSAIGPFAVPKAMSSTASATLATWFKIKGVNYSISSACATSNHCIGNAVEHDPVGQAGHDVRRRLRGARLDPVRAVRRHGRHVVQVQRHAGRGLPRL